MLTSHLKHIDSRSYSLNPFLYNQHLSLVQKYNSITSGCPLHVNFNLGQDVPLFEGTLIPWLGLIKAFQERSQDLARDLPYPRYQPTSESSQESFLHHSAAFLELLHASLSMDG
jgi:hypothetical protein